MKRRRLVLLPAMTAMTAMTAMVLAVAACNALLGNDEPIFVAAPADTGVDVEGGPPSDDAGPDGGGLDSALDATGDCEGGVECVIAESPDGPITSVSASPDGKTIYWAGPPLAGVVRRLDIDTRTITVVPIGTTGIATLVAAANDSVFVAVGPPPSIVRAGLSGGIYAVAPVFNAVTSMHFASSGLAALLWVEGVDMVRQCNALDQPNCGGSLLVLTMGTNRKVTALTAVEDYAVWINDEGGAFTSPTAAPIDSVIQASGTAAGGGRGSGSAATDEFVWGGTSPDGGPFIHRVFKGMATSLDLTQAPMSLTADATEIYWVSGALAGGRDIWTASRSLTGGKRKLAPNQKGVTDVVIASGGIYWTRQSDVGTKWQVVHIRK